MNGPSGMSNAADDIIRKLHLVAGDTLKVMNRECEKEMKAAYREFGDYQRDEIAAVFREAVQRFYDSYSPEYYTRTEGLYDVLDMRSSQDGTVEYDSVDDLLNPSLMHTDRHGGDLYQKVFVGGWHGGAESGDGHPSPGTPYYRKPYPFFTHWSRAAARSEPPYELFQRELSNAEGGRIYDAFVRISNRHNDQAMANVNRQLDSIMNRYFR